MSTSPLEAVRPRSLLPPTGDLLERVRLWLLSQTALPVFLATLAVYCALVPWMARVWARSGDEPHYLLAAHSLVADGDLDLGNNYAQRDYAAFYNEFYLNPHVRLRADGQQVLTHNLGLSIIIAPAYALGGLSGVLYSLAAVGALLATQVYGLGYDLTRNRAAALIGWAAVMFTPPVLWYVFLVYPEMLAALGLIVAVRIALRGNPELSLPFIRHRDQPRRGLTPPTRTHEASSSTQNPENALSHTPTRSQAPLYPAAHAPHTHLHTYPLTHLPLPHLITFGLALALLPWLSSRFLPPMALLVAWALWRAWRERRRGWLAGALIALGGLGGYMLFSFWLYGSASPAASYAGPTPLAVEQSFALLRVGRGLLGWLFDNQRGLFITAPIYLAALWGCAVLLFRRPVAGIAVLAPFAAALLPVAVWGGFWLGWEYSARFLIAALPLLGAGLAYLWAAGRRTVVLVVAGILFAFSARAGWLVIQQPLRGILSSPIEQLKPLADLETIVPAMARYAYLPAGRGAAVGQALANADDGGGKLGGAVTTAITEGPTWETLPGESGIVLRQVDLPEFAFGWYAASLPLEAPGAAPDTPVARIQIFSPSGGDYYAATLLARDLPAGGVYRFKFFSPLYNGWGNPPTVLVSSTGQAALRLGLLRIEPDLYHSLGLGFIWLTASGVVGVVVVGLALAGHKTVKAAPARPAPQFLPGLSAALALVAVASFAWSLFPLPRTYLAIEQQRTVGDLLSDPAAYGGQAMLADPARGHEAGKLAYTQPEQYAAGHYGLTLSLAALPGDAPLAPDQVIASVRVLGSDAAVLAQKWEITAGQLPADGNYYSLEFEFENPTAEALTFILDYAGAAGLKHDRLIVAARP